MGIARLSAIARVAVLATLLTSGIASVSVASAASVPTSPGGIGVRLLPNASSSTADPLTLTYIVERLSPGHRVLRDVEISNTTDAVAEVVVYPAAASYVDNKFTFAPGRTADSLSRWSKVAQSFFHLAAGASALDAVTINVPKGATFGERYGVIWATVSAPSPTRSGVRLINRVGVRMYVSVGKGGLPAASFTIGSLVAGRNANGDAFVVAKVHNVGVGAIDISGKLTLSGGPGELSAGPFPVALGTMLAPSHSVMEQVDLGGQIPRGPWRADLSLSSDGTQHSSVTMITFPAQILRNEKPWSIGPLMISVILILVLVSAAGVVVVYRRRRTRFERTIAAGRLRAPAEIKG